MFQQSSLVADFSDVIKIPDHVQKLKICKNDTKPKQKNFKLKLQK